MAVPSPSAHPGRHLSEREVEVLRVHATGLVQKKVADELGISPQTVKNHLSTAYAKLGVDTNIGAFKALGWLNPLEIATAPKPPEVGEIRFCIVCARDKAWGIFDGRTGAIVCADCRDAGQAKANGWDS